MDFLCKLLKKVAVTDTLSPTTLNPGLVRDGFPLGSVAASFSDHWIVNFCIGEELDDQIEAVSRYSEPSW